MPPRQYVPSTRAGHTGSCRSGPVRPMSSCVWTAPGRSTITTRPVSSAATGGHGHRPGGVAGPSAERAGQHRVQVDARSGRPRRPRSRSRAARGPGRTRARPPRRSGRRCPRCPCAAGTAARTPGTAPAPAAWPRAGRGWPSPAESRRAGCAPAVRSRCRGTWACAAPRRAAPAPCGKPGDGNLQRDARALVVGAGVECRAAALQLGGELLGGVLAGALRQRTHHDRGDAVEPVGLGVERHVQADLARPPPAARAGGSAARSARCRGRRARARGTPRASACPGAGCGWKSMVTAASVTARLRPACRPRPRTGLAAAPPCPRRSPARRPAPRGCRGAAAPRQPPGPPRR